MLRGSKMKRLDIDYTKHMAYPKSTGKALRARIREKYFYSDSLRIINVMDRKYEEFLRDIPYCGGKHNGIIWQLYEAVACFAYYEVLPEKVEIKGGSEWIR